MQYNTAIQLNNNAARQYSIALHEYNKDQYLSASALEISVSTICVVKLIHCGSALINVSTLGQLIKTT